MLGIECTRQVPSPLCNSLGPAMFFCLESVLLSVLCRLDPVEIPSMAQYFQPYVISSLIGEAREGTLSLFLVPPCPISFSRRTPGWEQKK